MPTYTMRCEACGHKFDTFVKTFRDKPTECVKCGGELKQIFAPPNFKINGWTPDKERQVDREIEEAKAIMAEPVDPGEARAGMDMLEEREKELGYEPGRLTGRVRQRKHKGRKNTKKKKE